MTRTLDAATADGEPDEGTRRMCEILVDMALRKLLAGRGASATPGR